MRAFEDVRAEVMAAVSSLDVERVPIWEAAGRILGDDLIAPESVPPFDNSAMDGFAVRGSDVATPGQTLEITDELRAGAAPTLAVGSGQAIRIMTGSPMPDGADTIVKVEDTMTSGSHVTVISAVLTGTSVRPAGGDIEAGAPVFSRGTRLTPMHVGVLATLGVGRPTVMKRPRVAFMSTGDELIPADGGPLGPGMIRDSNRPMLAALLRDAGVEAVDMGTIPDDEAALDAALSEASECDVIVTTGGVSMGEYDVTKLLLSRSGQVSFWKVAMQPAKPFAFGKVGSALFFGLPGNPVSVLVSYEQFVRPALMKLMGSRAIYRPRILAIADEDLVTDSEKTVFVRVKVTENMAGRLHVVTSGGQSSNVLSAAAAADAFAVVPRGTGTVSKGEEVFIELIHSPEAREEQDG